MILPPNPEEIMSVGWSVLERSAAEVTLGVCVCVLMIHSRAIQSHFQVCVIPVTMLG